MGRLNRVDITHLRPHAPVAGYRKLYAVARETVDHALAYAFAGRKQRKRQFRSLWIVRLNAALRPLDITYSRFINGLKHANIDLDRRVLAELAMNDPTAFQAVVDVVKQHV